MTTTDDFSNPLASADDESPAATDAAVEADTDVAPVDGADEPDAADTAAAVSGEGPDDALVVEVGPAEAVELPGDAEILDVTDLDDDDEVVEAEPSPYDRPGRWFVVHTYAGYENKVKQNLASRVRSMNVEERIFEVVIPMEDVIEFKNGRKVVVQKKVWPGYLLIRLALDDESWYVVRNTPGVTGFVGSGAKPTPLTRREVEEMARQGRAGRGPAGEEGPPAARVRGGRAGAGHVRPVRRLQRRDQRDRRRPLEAQGAGEHLRP